MIMYIIRIEVEKNNIIETFWYTGVGVEYTHDESKAMRYTDRELVARTADYLEWDADKHGEMFTCSPIFAIR